MPKIKVMNRFEAEKYSSGWHNTPAVIVSIADYNGIPANLEMNSKNKIKAIHREYFQDCEVPDKTTITFTQAQNIANFYNTWKDKVSLIIIHCNGGISRSSAIAASFQRLETKYPSIFNDSTKHPNSLVYFTMLKAFNIPVNKDEEWDLLIKSDINYRAKNGGIRF